MRGMKLAWGQEPPQTIPVSPKNEPVWATFVPTRSPDFKTHSNIGQAKNAMYGRRSALYELQGDYWALRISNDDVRASGGRGSDLQERMKDIKRTPRFDRNNPVVVPQTRPPARFWVGYTARGNGEVGVMTESGVSALLDADTLELSVSDASDPILLHRVVERDYYQWAEGYARWLKSSKVAA